MFIVAGVAVGEAVAAAGVPGRGVDVLPAERTAAVMLSSGGIVIMGSRCGCGIRDAAIVVETGAARELMLGRRLVAAESALPLLRLQGLLFAVVGEARGSL